MLILILIIFILISLFIRLPNNKINQFKGLISPANGTIQWIKKTNTETTVHIFIGLEDIHYQVYPISGQIINQKYYNTGLFYPANIIASRNNERFITYIKSENDIIRVDQIAGLIARRIYNINKIGDNIVQGKYLGIITLGSGAEITFKHNRFALLEGIIKGSKIKLGEPLAIEKF